MGSAATFAIGWLLHWVTSQALWLRCGLQVALSYRPHPSRVGDWSGARDKLWLHSRQFKMIVDGHDLSRAHAL